MMATLVFIWLKYSGLVKLFSIKVNDEYESPADVLHELPLGICEFLFLKLPCSIKRVRKSKELELCCIIFKTQAHYRFVHGFFCFQFHHKIWI